MKRTISTKLPLRQPMHSKTNSINLSNKRSKKLHREFSQRTSTTCTDFSNSFLQETEMNTDIDEFIREEIEKKFRRSKVNANYVFPRIEQPEETTQKKSQIAKPQRRMLNQGRVIKKCMTGLTINQRPASRSPSRRSNSPKQVPKFFQKKRSTSKKKGGPVSLAAPNFSIAPAQKTLHVRQISEVPKKKLQLVSRSTKTSPLRLYSLNKPRRIRGRNLSPYSKSAIISSKSLQLIKKMDSTLPTLSLYQ